MLFFWAIVVEAICPFAAVLVYEDVEGDTCHSINLDHGSAVECLMATFPDFV